MCLKEHRVQVISRPSLVLPVNRMSIAWQIRIPSTSSSYAPQRPTLKKTTAESFRTVSPGIKIFTISIGPGSIPSELWAVWISVGSRNRIRYIVSRAVHLNLVVGTMNPACRIVNHCDVEFERWDPPPVSTVVLHRRYLRESDVMCRSTSLLNPAGCLNSRPLLVGDETWNRSRTKNWIIVSDVDLKLRKSARRRNVDPISRTSNVKSLRFEFNHRTHGINRIKVDFYDPELKKSKVVETRLY